LVHPDRSTFRPVLRLHDALPLEVAWAGLLGFVAGIGWAVWSGWRAFRRPQLGDALARLDATLPGRPIATLSDAQAVGAADPASAAVWRAHLQRMAARAATARAVAPDLRLARRDPYGLRYMALTALVMALMFGSVWRAASVAGMGPGAANAVIAGPSWEGWLQPPVYTGRPSLYLPDLSDTVEVPVGSRVQVRMYGEVGALTLAETVSGRAGTDVPPASEPAQDFEVRQDGQIEIAGPGGRVWRVIALRDAPPEITAEGTMTRERDGQFALPFAAQDDFAVTAGQATITLDLAAIDRRHGLTPDPEPREAVVLDLPLPIRAPGGIHRNAAGRSVEAPLRQPAGAGAPFRAGRDRADGLSEPFAAVLPGKRFFDPLAAAVIEVRRDLLWNRENARRRCRCCAP
jgi:hypothetical protein